MDSHDNSDPETPVFPPVEKHSGQKEGELMRAFFERRRIRNALAAARETRVETQARMQKEKHAARHDVPGKGGARVYYWEDVAGFRVQRAGGRQNYKFLWRKYGYDGRRYDSFDNEWDLCSEFSDDESTPKKAPLDDDSDDDWDDDDIIWCKPSSTQTQPTPEVAHSEAGAGSVMEVDREEGEICEEGEISGGPTVADIPLLPNTVDHADHNKGEYSSSADLTRIFGDEPSEVFQTPISQESLEDRAYYRFGFTPPTTEVEPTHYTPRWFDVRKYLGNGLWLDESSAPDPPKRTQEALCTFFGYMHGSQSLKDMPAVLYDVLQEDSDLRRLKNVKIRLQEERFNGRWYYFIQPAEQPPQWVSSMYLALTSASALLEIIRHPFCSDIVSIYQWLLNKGIAFNTFVPGPQLPQESKQQVFVPRYIGLGFRPANYKPDELDFRAYVSSRDRLLRSPRGRAALLAGGIVARLAREVVDTNAILSGPSDSVFADGRCYWNGDSSSSGYWDDDLTQDELDKICGVYRVATGILISKFDMTFRFTCSAGRSDNGRPQTSDLSWWPKPSVWEDSGLWVGYWSEDCEKWFQQRLAACHSGRADLKNATQWRHTIRYSKPAVRMAEKNEARTVDALYEKW
ncbi:hypothetical protein Hypma_014528 [Hypsizygus marmoreus]|uniref:Uncharacterized protein n=1 Tax=Hypsizygus marmoreus TaxID=39966 RepID=A0A369J9N7_HYPMA|nr:hypothetical protein Hypma_014528 [Hypsizygus marmoreus]